MNPSNHSMHDLFAQLGLPNDEAQVQNFVSRHGPMPNGMQLSDAPFWTEAQARFLRDEIREDADWAEVVDQLNLMLHD